MSYSKPRGTVDLFNQEMYNFQQLQDLLLKLGQKFNFKQIKTPVFEHVELFTRSAGETSDLVSKEMYVFKDKGDRTIALRPEGTAGVIRAVVENKMLNNQPLPLKLMYFESCFRYERPQAGRQRQFHQFGVEVLGSNSIYSDFESIVLANHILEKLKINEYVLEINYISDANKRAEWIKVLKDYFYKFYDQLEEVSQQRLEQNPLRILDDKIESQKEFVKKAPKISNFLNEDEKREFQTLLNLLDESNISYKINEGLVRGLDYYTGVVFEFISTSELLKGQSTLIGGGRYSNLVSEVGGEDAQGVGFGLGVERILIAASKNSENIFKKYNLDYYVAALDQQNVKTAVKIANQLRKNKQQKVEASFSNLKFDKIFKNASNQNARKVIIVASKELESNQVIIKDQETFEQSVVDLNELFKNN